MTIAVGSSTKTAASATALSDVTRDFVAVVRQADFFNTNSVLLTDVTDPIVYEYEILGLFSEDDHQNFCNQGRSPRTRAGGAAMLY
jgi:hypothetical protein